MKKFKKLMTLSLAGMLALSGGAAFVGCGDGGDDGGFDEDGNYRPSASGTTIQFWGYGDAAETNVFGNIVKKFNETIGSENNVKVEYTAQPSNGYSSAASMQLSSSSPPDVVYVEDALVKSWADSLYLEQLDKKDENGNYVYKGLEEFLGGKVWEQGIGRYRYDVDTATVTDSSALWALPKDIGPTVLYYNKKNMQRLGIEIVSVPADGLKEKGYPEKGFFEKEGKKYFNNRIPMSWDETIALAQLQQREGLCRYGFFTEWWFSYGWSVGGDCVEYVTDADGAGYYEFTLNDETYNWIVKDDVEKIEVNGNEYKGGEIVSYADKKSAGFTSEKQANCNRLPSMKDAFLEFCALTTPDGKEVGTRSDGSKKLGNRVSMGADSLGTQQAEDLFVSGEIGMFVDGRWEVTFLREEMEKGSWDVAPLPQYKEYDQEGNVTVHGIRAGHSGSVGLAIAEGSSKKSASWLFLRYVAGEAGQTSQSEAGFCIPNQKDLANSPVFLQTEQDPINSIVFVEAAEHQTPGDWWYLKNNLWIDKWANCLNHEVREGKKTVDYLFETYSESTQKDLYSYTNYKPKA